MIDIVQICRHVRHDRQTALPRGELQGVQICRHVSQSVDQLLSQFVKLVYDNFDLNVFFLIARRRHTMRR